MRIAYYMPFKPLDHPNPSGDLIIGKELFNHLASKGHKIELVSRLRCRWIYYHPATLLRYFLERSRISGKLQDLKPDLWLTYHSYYKAPDLLGRYCSKKLNIPYVIFQGIYSTKRSKQFVTRAGYLLNKKSLLAADHIFTNKKRDYQNLRRLLPADRLDYVAPGINPTAFFFSENDRKSLHHRWEIHNETVIMTAAMMRPDVKTEGISNVIDCCAKLQSAGHRIRLIIAGDGDQREKLETKASMLIPGKVIFLGKISREQLYKYYSAADIFVFPGVNESLGMVYLEAQSCGLPIVAYKDWGGGEAVIDRETGLLATHDKPEDFLKNIKLLLDNRELRQKLGCAATVHIRKNHDLQANYAIIENKLPAIIARR